LDGDTSGVSNYPIHFPDFPVTPVGPGIDNGNKTYQT